MDANGRPVLEFQKLLQAVLDAQSVQWGLGERLSAEQLFERHPQLLDDPETALDVIYQEFLLRQELGERPQPEEYIRRFPALSELLIRQFAVDDAMWSAEKTTERHHARDLGEPDGSTGTSSVPAGRHFDTDDAASFFPGHELLGVIGRGGMGVVYKARNTLLDRVVAIKTITELEPAKPNQAGRLLDEARAAARLQHPNIITVHEIGEHNGRPYFVQEFADGGDLKRQLTVKPMAARQSAELLETLSRAVHAAHQSGIVHRDLKPSNILLTAEGVPKVADFGLAKFAGGDSGRTQSGQVVGTPSYMAPEQAEGRSKDVGPVADVYALGAILYETLTGRPPFLGDSQLETLRLVCSAEPVPPKRLRPDIPRDLETICLKCLEKSPGKRYVTALDLADDLGRFVRGEPILARPTGAARRFWKWARRHPWQTTSAALVLLAVSALFGLTYRHNRELQAETDRTQATAASGLVQQLFKIDTPQIPGIIQAIGGYRRWTDPELRQAIEATSVDPKVKLHASLALLPVDASQVSYLQTRLLGADWGELPVLRDALEPYRADLIASLWTAVESAKAGDPRLLPSAGALALYDPEGPRWAGLSGKVAEALVMENSLIVGARFEALRPVRDKVLIPLAAILRDKSRSETDRSRVADILVSLGRDDPGLLADLLMDSDADTYRRIFLVAEPHAEKILPLFRAELAKKAGSVWNDPPIDPSWTKPAPAILDLIESAQGLIDERFALCQTMLLSDFLPVAEGLRKSGYRPVRFRPFTDGQELKVAAVWTRDRRSWRMASDLLAEEVRREDERNRQHGFIPVDVSGYIASNAAGKPANRYGGLWVERGDSHEELQMFVGDIFENRVMVQKRLIGDNMIPRSINSFRSAEGIVRFSGVMCRNQRPASSPAWHYSWRRSYESLPQMQLIDRDLVFTDVAIRAADMPLTPGEHARAILAAVEEHLALNPNDWFVRYDRAIALIRLGEFQKALAEFDAVISKAPRESVTGYQFLRAVVHARLGHKKEALDDLAAVQRSSLSASIKLYSSAVVAAELGEGERDAFDQLESALEDKRDDPAFQFNAACAYSMASQVVARKDESRGREYAERAISLLTAAIRSGASDYSHIRQEPSLDPIRDGPAFAELIRGKSNRFLGGILFQDASVEGVTSLGLDPAAHLRKSRDLIAQGYRPISLSVCRPEPAGPLVTASAWHRPSTSEEARDALAERQARAAAALSRLGRADEVWPLLKHSADPRLRSFILNWLNRLGVDPRVLATEFVLIRSNPLPSPAAGYDTMDSVFFHPETSLRRALVLALGTYRTEELSPGERETLIGKLLDLFQSDPDAGIHGAAEWTLRQWGQQVKLASTQAELSQLRDRGSRRWYVDRQGQTFAIIGGPVEFRMGSSTNEPERDSDETPHRQTIPYRFAIASKEVTREQFQRFLLDNPQFDVNRDDLNKYSPTMDGPRIFVSWFGAVAYCNWLSAQDGLPKDQWCYSPNEQGEYATGMTMPTDFTRRAGYRLPTEAEWEYACRAGAITSRYYGLSMGLLERYACYATNFGVPPCPQQCGRLLPNELGLFDMMGNAREWCQEYYTRYGTATTESAIGDLTDDNPRFRRLLRGGAFDLKPASARSADREMAGMSTLGGDISFRVARTCD